jgi:hypothetical protein
MTRTFSAEKRVEPIPTQLRKIVSAFMLAAGILYVFSLGASTFAPATAAGRDFIEYWAAGQQVRNHANPYDAVAIARLEHQAGVNPLGIRISLSPPVALAFALPLGYLSPRAGLIMCFMAQLACLMLSAWLPWRCFGKPRNRLHLLIFLFAPAVACEMSGQLGIFLLTCIVLFLYFHRTRPFLAGVVLMPMALKPHLALPFAAVLLLWIVWKHAASLAAGFFATLGVSCALSLYFDPHVWRHYSELMASNGVLDWSIPALSVYLRVVIRPGSKWIEFVPAMLATAWAVWYFWTRRRIWSWTDNGLLVLAVGVVCAPYAWFMDESILFPAVLWSMYRATQSGRSLIPLFAINLAALAELIGRLDVQHPYFLWTSPAWLLWYLYATRGPAVRGEGAVSEPARE